MIAQFKKITCFGANGLLGTADPADKKPAVCFLMAGIKNGNYVRSRPRAVGFDCNNDLLHPAPGPSGSGTARGV